MQKNVLATKKVASERGARFLQVRQSRQQKQSDFAKDIGVDQRVISLCEHGQLPNKQVLAWLIANGYSLDWLFTGEGSMLRAAPQDDFAKLLKAVMEMAREKGML